MPPLYTGLATNKCGKLKTGLGHPYCGVDYSGEARTDTVVPENFTAWVGYTPTWLWRGGDASGATELTGNHAATHDMVDYNSPTKEVYSAALDANTTALSGTQYMAPTATAAGDMGDESYVIIVVVEAVSLTASKSFVSKRESSGSQYGWQFYTPSFFSNQITHLHNTPAGSRQQTVSDSATGAQVYMMQIDDAGANDVNALIAQFGAATTTDSISTPSNGQVLRVGASNFSPTSSQDIRFGCLAIFTGTEAEGWTAADRTTIAEKLGIE